MASIASAKIKSQLCSLFCKPQLMHLLMTTVNFLITAAIAPGVFDTFFLVHLYFRCNPGWVYMRQVFPHCVVLFGLTVPRFLYPALYYCSGKTREDLMRGHIWSDPSPVSRYKLETIPLWGKTQKEPPRFTLKSWLMLETFQRVQLKGGFRYICLSASLKVLFLIAQSVRS